MTIHKVKHTDKSIYAWMQKHIQEHIDVSCNEVNLTSLVEAWDNECDSGEATLDSDHIAWSIAVEVSDWWDLQKEINSLSEEV